MRAFIAGALALSLLPTLSYALSPKTEAVAAFVGVMSFVKGKCFELTVDPQAVYFAAVERGIDIEDLMQDPEFKALGVSAYRGMMREQDKACAMALHNFGPAGAIIPGLIRHR
ncbi:hypothetical protein [Methylobacterium sp. 13MFTsu3.1M2]|uniref:hypothetical protein n=1 Tax=Methylobacterium sp. 13MFTsu3.1M2 TaxID=1502776 RepID=UPI0008EB2995|nr:hypothetical protein [Methylobacterium sp. 13MFTsu3.1M2]SFE10101.1 hypothetical protein SAMN02799627_02561 [Methylobacterium sp. 13MFTsu3.1M2]